MSDDSNGTRPPFGDPALPPGGGVLEPLLQVDSAIAPAWAMAAQALQASDQDHVRTGLHLRVLTSPLLGLPITPFRILEQPVDLDSLREDVVWTDTAPLPRHLHPPFQVTPDRPAIGWLPSPAADATCCWIRIDDRRGDDLTVSAMVPTTRGPRCVARRSDGSREVWASSISHVLIEGTGTVTGAAWLPASVRASRLLKLTALPVARPHPRYAALDDGVLQAAARVTRGAPLRRALYDVAGSPRPFDAPPLAIPVEVGRVGLLGNRLHPDLLRLVDERVLDPALLTTTSPVIDDQDEEIGTSASSCLDAVLQASLDHGLARWLGFLDNDLIVNDDVIAARVVTTVFAPDWMRLLTSGVALSIPPDAVVADLATLRDRYPDFEALGDLEGTVSGPFLDLAVTAAWSPGGTLDLPSPPHIVGVTDRPTRTPDVEVPGVSAWIPGVPPAATRSTRLDVGGLVAGAVLAFARDDLDGTGAATLNEPSPAATFHEPLVAAVTATASGDSADAGTLTDRGCPAAAVRYHVAQADWFGRWSDWSSIDLAAGVRPRSPVPIIRAWATQAQPADPTERGPLAGTISATIPVPAPTDLPPGAHLLTALRFQVTDAANVTTSTDLVIDDPAAPPSELSVTVPAPALTPGMSTTVHVGGYWMDAGPGRSLPAEGVELTIWDPRPPGPVIVDPQLRYSARPDVTGRATVELTWPAASPQELFRVYVADETTLGVRVAALAADGDAAAAALIAALDAAPDAVARGEAWTAHAAVLPRDAFSLITPEPLARTAATMRFEHVLSGSLRTLALYRIVAVSGANVDVDFAGSPVVPYAVPNTLPPPQPHLAARVLDPAATGAPAPTAELTITVPRGSRRAVEFRLRRSRVSAADPLLMPVVATGPLHPPDDPAATHVEVVTDLGPTTLEPDGVLSPWNTYTWRVEVRAEPEAGGGPPGAWSRPSAPAGAAVVPLADPPAPVIRAVTRGPVAVRVAVDVPAELRGGSLGSYRLELYRQLADDHERLVATIPEQQRPTGDRTWVFVDAEPAGGPSPGTRYRAVVVDPRSRRSAPSAPRPAPRLAVEPSPTARS